MKPTVTIRGTRILVTPSADIELPEADRRVFQFLNPSVRAWDQLVNDCQRKLEDGSAVTDTKRLLNALLRDWSNVRTELAVVARKYGVRVGDGTRCESLLVPFPAGAAAGEPDLDLHDVISLEDYREIVNGVLDAIVPRPSGN